jgi:phosphoglycolate phosphatase
MEYADYEAVVFDLDGTLVRLAVDWDVAAADAIEALRERGVDPPADLWAALDRAVETGHRDAVEAVLADHERTGAREGQRLPLAEDLPLDCPTAICSLNGEAAVRTAVERHSITGVGSVVGRDSLASGAYKPDPEPLLSAVEALSATPERTLFVGDSERDAVTAERAGVPFRWVEEGVPRE